MRGADFCRVTLRKKIIERGKKNQGNRHNKEDGIEPFNDCGKERKKCWSGLDGRSLPLFIEIVNRIVQISISSAGHRDAVYGKGNSCRKEAENTYGN